ncbi:MAG: hypothetical protein COB30_011350 [Ectothiorhodospiraceae bacterium]|nr:hypothetical protein [Ectothiorhodospiraceae bacterium]
MKLRCFLSGRHASQAFGFVFISTFVFTFVFAMLPALAVADNYFDALESEVSENSAKSSNGDSKGSNNDSNNASNYLDTLDDEADSSAHVPTGMHDAIPGEALAKLGMLLQKKKPTTFKYYDQLNAADQMKILKIYQAGSDSQTQTLSKIRKRVLDLYFQR